MMKVRFNNGDKDMLAQEGLNMRKEQDSISIGEIRMKLIKKFARHYCAVEVIKIFPNGK